MYQHTTDTLDFALQRHGFTEAWRKKVIEAKMRESAEHERQQHIGQARGAARSNGMPGWLLHIVIETATEHGVSPMALLSIDRHVNVVRARHTAIYRAKDAKPLLSLPRLGMWFDRDHTTIGHALASYQRDHPEATIYTRHDLGKRHASTARFQASRRRQGTTGDARNA